MTAAPRRRRFQPSYVYVVFSTMLVLFTFGLLGLLFQAGNTLAQQLKEQLEFSLILKDNVSEKDALRLTDSLRQIPWVKSATYISKQEAARLFTEQTGEDFSDLLDYNPLFASINLTLDADYTHPDSLNRLQTTFERHRYVTEFHYERPIVTLLHEHLRTLTLILTAVAALLLLAAFSIIDSTIRLAVYASRMLIRSMQLVGATHGFIIKPFLTRSMLNGLMAALLAVVLLFLLVRFLAAELPETATVFSPPALLVVFGGMFLLGLAFSLFSTWLAVRKYLRMKVEELY